MINIVHVNPHKNVGIKNGFKYFRKIKKEFQPKLPVKNSDELIDCLDKFVDKFLHGSYIGLYENSRYKNIFKRSSSGII